MNREEIKNKIREQTDLIRYPFDEFWFDVGFDESEKKVLELIDEDLSTCETMIVTGEGDKWIEIESVLKRLRDSITAK